MCNEINSTTSFGLSNDRSFLAFTPTINVISSTHIKANDLMSATPPSTTHYEQQCHAHIHSTRRMGQISGRFAINNYFDQRPFNKLTEEMIVTQCSCVRSCSKRTRNSIVKLSL
jgi:hypothetical protein